MSQGVDYQVGNGGAGGESEDQERGLVGAVAAGTHGQSRPSTAASSSSSSSSSHHHTGCVASHTHVSRSGAGIAHAATSPSSPDFGSARSTPPTSRSPSRLLVKRGGEQPVSSSSSSIADPDMVKTETSGVSTDAGDDSARILGKRPARSPPSPTTTASAGSSMSRTTNPAAYTKTATQTRSIARQLLELVTCASCNRPYTTPITLPCGHSTCLPCISARLKNITAINQAAAGPSTRTTHVPPRLPLCTMTVPCSVNGCPRSAIGQGLGVWAGYSAAYGPPDSEAWVDEDVSSPGNDDEQEQQASSAERGSLPVDGFVVGADNESLRLGVIPPQLREKANTFAVSPFPWEQDGGNTLSLRPDVTLAKAVAVLQRYALEPPGEERRSSGQRARRSLIGFATARRHAAHHPSHLGFSSSSSLSSSSGSHRRTRMPGRPGPSSVLARGTGYTEHAMQRNGRAASNTRPGTTKIARHFLPMLGGSEAERESGSVAGVTAADTDDEDEEEGYHQHYGPNVSRTRRRAGTMGRSYRSGRYGGAEFDGSGGEQQEDSEVSSAQSTPEGGSAEETATVDRSSGNANTFDGAFGQQLQRQQSEAQATASHEPTITVDASGAAVAVEAPKAVPTPPPGTVASTMGKLDEVFKLTTPEHLQSDLVDTLECQLCYFLLYEPTTTPCGHTFCRGCFARSLDHSNKCPLCRTTMPSFSFFQNHPSNQALMKLLTSQCGAPQPNGTTGDDKLGDTERSRREGSASSSTYPQEDLMSLSRLGVFADSHTASSSPYRNSDDDDDEALSFGLRHLYHERALTIEEEERQTSSWMPIFVCTLAFPTMPTNLHIFEPRYKLMIRRCLQGPGPGRFGMVLPSRSSTGPVPGLHEYGTMLEIKNHTMLLDGRSMLETVGWRRFRLLEKNGVDGYTTGRVEYFDDISSGEVAAEEESVVASNREAVARRDRAEQERVSASSASQAGSPAAPEGDTNASSQASSEASAPGTAPVQEASSAATTPLPPAEQAPTMTDLIRTATSFIELLRTQTQTGLFEQIVATYGPVPQPLEIDKLSWWLGMVLPIDEHAKSSLLPVRSPRKRLEMIATWIERIEGSWRSGR
ncbi:hypothetical protein BCV69DRAFT_68918 [Microstroma glucosiphilum]|uniref:LON-domain-containing protein n=1 Tax=Pseudomicrostroma glucosiphilum TaxID=1684307 RepID=A0A316U1A2_9BASI|nr:hypothetical protein BCV69DRAFT_68918 [Pseudomicrostroma glucosiphilum]PWN18634.1 hypothetical protein BCV69DRAFT_68918 [Pseudomicrostroma glucosiphilum]